MHRRRNRRLDRIVRCLGDFVATSWRRLLQLPCSDLLPNSRTIGGLAIGAEGVAIGFRSSPYLAATGFAVSTAVGLVAGCIPAWEAARINLVQALREN